MANTLPTDSNSTIYEGLRDPSGLQFVAKQSGTVTTDAGGVKSAPEVVHVDNLPATQAISAVSLPLPSGAATESGNLATIVTNTTGLATQTTLAAAKTDLDTLAATVSGGKVTVGGTLAVSSVAGTVSTSEANSAAIASSASTTATQTTTTATNTTGLNNAVGTSGSPLPTKGLVVQGSDGVDARTISTDASGRPNVNVNGSVAVTGTFWQATQPVSAASLPLPTNAAQETGGNLATLAGAVSAGKVLTTESNSASIKTDLDSVVTNTGRIPAQGGAATAASLPVNIASDQIVPVKGSYTELTGGAGVTGVGTFAIAATDVSAYKWLSIQIAGTFTLTNQFEISNDNVNWTTCFLTNMTTSSYGALVSGTGATGFYAGAVSARYFRVRCSAYTSNASLAVTLELFTDAPAMNPGTTSIVATPSTTSTGCSDYHLISAATTNANSVKASHAQLYGYDISNNGAGWAYVKLYNTAGTPTAGSGTPLRVIGIAPGSSARYTSTNGIAFGTGIGLTITGGAADADTTAVAASQVVVAIEYF